jgi:hypothetical protein
MKKKKVNKSKQTLEFHMKNFVSKCKQCNQKLKVHAFRPPGKKQSAVFAHCENDACCYRLTEVSFPIK